MGKHSSTPKKYVIKSFPDPFPKGTVVTRLGGDPQREPMQTQGHVCVCMTALSSINRAMLHKLS